MNKSAAPYSSQPLSDATLLQENLQFSGTAGISASNRKSGFIPAFMDTLTGNVYPSRFANGMPAPIHVLTGLPDNLVEIQGNSGAPVTIKNSVVSGFLHEETFYSREQAAQATASGCLH